METFSIPPLLLDISSLASYINMISSSTISTDPWIVPAETNINSFGDRIPLSPIELNYEAIHLACVTHSDLVSSINQVDHSLDYGMSSDPFSCEFPTDESIMEIMMPNDVPLDDHHHHSSLSDSIKDNPNDFYQPNIVELSTNYVSIHEVDSNKNY